MLHDFTASSEEQPQSQPPGRIRRLAGQLIPVAAAVFDAAALVADVAQHDGLAECIRGGATALRAAALVFRGRGPTQS